MEVVCLNVERGHPCIGDLDAFFITIGVDPAGDGKPGLGAGAGDQLDDDLMVDQRFAAPVLGDKGEQTVLDAVPFAGFGWQMADGDRDTKIVCQDLRFALPQAHARAVAAATMGGDQLRSSKLELLLL